MSTQIQGTTFGEAWVDVANWALRRIGSSRISSLSDGSPNQLVVSDMLGDAIMEVVYASNDWSILKARQQLSIDPTYVPPTDFLYAYSLPSDYEGFVSIETLDSPYAASQVDPTNPKPVRPMYPWSFESQQGGGVGPHILTNGPYAYLTYIRGIVNEDGVLAAKSFRCAVQACLAVSVEMSLRGNTRLRLELQKESEKAIATAIMVDDRAKETKLGPDERGYTWYDENRFAGWGPGSWPYGW